MNFRTVLTISAFTLALASPAMAQDAAASDPGHPRVSQIDQRLQDQQNRIDQGTATGQIGSSRRAAADEARDARISAEATRDEAKNNGHLTAAEQQRMNRQLNRNSRKIHRQRTN